MELTTASLHLITFKLVGKLKTQTELSKEFLKKLLKTTLLFGQENLMTLCGLFALPTKHLQALKNCNLDLIAAGEKRMFQLHELDELRHQAYENSRLYKERTKVWYFSFKIWKITTCAQKDSSTTAIHFSMPREHSLLVLRSPKYPRSKKNMLNEEEVPCPAK
ncbi:hypothetical protein Tco_0549557 [Tanacetum coccineum]